jgi:hypothetical protein
MARKTTTSNAVKARWKAKNYKSYQVNLRLDTDADLIQFVESRKDQIGTSAVFRDALRCYNEANLDN